MKRIISLLLVFIMICSMLVGCGDAKSEIEPTDNLQIDATISTDDGSIDAEKPTDESKEEVIEPTKSEDEKLAEAKTTCEQQLASIKIELLSVDRALPYKQNFLGDGYRMDEYGGVASMITIGIDYGNKETRKASKGVTICGETATDPADSECEAYQTSQAYGLDDDSYVIMCFKINGDVDPSKAHVLIKGAVDGVAREVKFDNNGEPVGYENAIAKFSDDDDNMGMDSSIIKLKDRHYKVIVRGRDKNDVKLIDSSDPSKGVEVTFKYRLALLPLEGGEKSSLKIEDITLSYIDETLNRDDIVFTYKVGTDNVFGGTEKIHTVLTATGTYTIPGNATMDGDYIDSGAYISHKNEIAELFENVQFSTTNENGEVETIFQLTSKD